MNILIVEDERQIAEYLYKYLTKSGFEVSTLNSGEHVVETVKSQHPDLIILDLMLPVKDGVSCCKELRLFSDVPVIMLTAKVSDIDRIIGLEAGADDYVCKPFNAKELVLRVKSILKRAGFKSSKSEGFRLNKQTQELEFNGSSQKLTRLEYALIRLLFNKPGRIFSRQEIINLAYVEERDITERAVDSHVKNIRKKIRNLGIDTVVIECVYSAGYQLIPPEPDIE
ncbi:response regulator transcription factor [Aliikangiella coralliicola]|uniref:Response regulator transcription factor n=1 Tax=Aliikangiella coralliicola TaxID=2592383 RepID=A0A545UJ44_9GAMM|nr:response regulator transcription factor [Aliikangiella coralliicola]TQV89487.1 response regulator transcription factor [Aliikangiella coralliicola]